MQEREEGLLYHQFHKKLLASSLIVVGAFLPIVWAYFINIPDYTFIFCESIDKPWRFNLNPVQPLIAPSSSILPIIFEILNGIVLLVSMKICSTIKVPYLGDLWYYTIFYEIVKFIDFILVYRQTEFRFYAVLIITSIHILGCLLVLWKIEYEKNS